MEGDIVTCNQRFCRSDSAITAFIGKSDSALRRAALKLSDAGW
ncbi:MAG: hypothetical protein ACRCU9_12585 [Iodobacter sp.]